MLREDDESANTVFLTVKVNHLEMIKMFNYERFVV